MPKLNFFSLGFVSCFGCSISLLQILISDDNQIGEHGLGTN